MGLQGRAKPGAQDVSRFRCIRQLRLEPARAHDPAKPEDAPIPVNGGVNVRHGQPDMVERPGCGQFGHEPVSLTHKIG